MIIENYFKNKFGNFRISDSDYKKSVKFIHASDIHLGAAQYRNEYRSNDFIQAFQEILELAITNHADFVGMLYRNSDFLGLPNDEINLPLSKFTTFSCLKQRLV